MKFEFEHEIQVPFEEKTFILPQPRIKLFQNLIENYKVFCPELKLIYAFLNYQFIYWLKSLYNSYFKLNLTS